MSSILEGKPTLGTDEGEVVLRPGVCAGFPASGIAHQLVNRTDRDIVYLEVGDRTAGDVGTYPADDLAATDVESRWVFRHQDGTSLLT